jgi:hypothetical protein
MTSRTLVLVSALIATSAITIAQSPADSGQPPQRPQRAQQPQSPQQPQPTPPASPAPGQPSRGTPPPTVSQPPPPAPPRREGQPINVKVEVTITDQSGGTQTLKKTVTVVTGDQMSGFIRSTAFYDPPIGAVPLNVDIEPQLLTDNRIRVRLNLQYNLPSSEGRAAGAAGSASIPPLRTTGIQENLAMILDNGKPLVVAQSADPVGDRQVTIEVKATVLR